MFDSIVEALQLMELLRESITMSG